ncbi:unnamed protein product [Aphanomyces euteiches]|uniref:Saccharopine dehydrogenase NADP binding domain-containing protein n=1 Tax=Aphanomyces euteiches TaxID=100861 RepID=A0A6G0X4R9_9STRA|nr:hypothetical protein Ae201684_008556 [Aphanomyces euteiches]KAH9085605.1 hypothetical protein Ae201684P_005311 [Aphanomyces euteiches]KAH9154355.1 hypothetical protein AeRB84_003544 [Aphanomyces euteiches]
MAREFDIVVFGASGFTGQYVALCVAKRARELKTPLKWAIAGRSKVKLQDTAEWIQKQVEVEKIPIVIADVFDSPALEAMCKSTAILLNCTGPYAYFGEPVLKACIEVGTHHLDLAGEVQFILEMLVKHDKAAKAKDCIVVSAVGYDSLPTELSVLFAESQFPSNGSISTAEVFMGMDVQHGHATTYECIVLMSNPAHFKATNRLAKQLPAPAASSLLSKSWFGYDSRLGKAYFRFMGADMHLVGLSNPRVETVVYYYMNNLLFVVAFAIFGLLLATFGQFEYGRQLMIRYPRLFTAGAFSHEGPSPSQLNAGSFTTHCFAKGFQDKTKAGEGTPHDWQVQVRVDGPEPGYVATPILMVEAALCIWRGEVKARGVLSPGAAFRGTSLIKALETQGIAFTAVKSAQLP